VRYVEAAGARLSAVGLGCWQFGAKEWGYGTEYATTTAPEIVRRSLDLGVTFYDTAEIYAFGRSEQILGRALVGRRDEAFVASKLFPVLPIGPVVHRRARGSARRLGVDTIDLYQLHWPNPIVPLSTTMGAMAELVAEGLIRHVGVSNYSLARWQEAERALGAPVLSNQVQYSLVHRQPEADLVPWAQANGRIVIAYSPLAQGLLSGRYDAEHPPGAMRGGSSAFLTENLRRAGPLIDTLRQVAAAHDATPAQVSLAWVLRQPGVAVIPGASSVAQAESNAAAADLELADDELAALTAASDAYRPITGWAAVPPVAAVRAERLAARARRLVSADHS